MAGLVVLTAAATVVCLAVGRYALDPADVVRILASRVHLLTDLVPQTWTDSDERVVVMVRGPRVASALLIGASLAVCGAAMQAAFRNPLVNPQILGVSHGASFGGVLAIAMGWSAVALVSAALAGGLAVLALVWALSRREGGGALTVVLAGVIIGAFFSALVSVVTYLADPYDTLPGIVFWLMGSLATSTWPTATVVAVTTLIGMLVVVPLRWRLNVLTLSDEEGRGLGVPVAALRWVVLGATALMVAGAVSVSGVIGWIGLVIPHLTRLIVGPDHRVLVPASALLGGVYLLVIDTLARTVTAGEVPLGALTALIGAPVFFLLLHTNRRRVWNGD
ncbi:iron ABC transporter permease [Nocardiopsis sp. HNM0947]|uniref:Iron ABC transporter permease n=2 Tax=Nocardiopsis coralli TaxID=2772213 RepID=A0ABR9P9A5_9ACTN|nr:iron ABC transporter permease [Nocardiopsis coralli]